MNVNILSKHFSPVIEMFYYTCICCSQGTYQDYIAADEEVKQLLSDIIRLVDENSEECKVSE